VSRLDRTHDAALHSWLPSANLPGTDFPIQNLPFCVFRRAGMPEAPRCGVGIGDAVMDVGQVAGLFDGLAATAANACHALELNPLMELGPEAATALRVALSALLAADHTAHRDALSAALLPTAGAELLRPVRIGAFADFFASVHHATNAGRLFRPDAPLLPNYKYVPVAYNGRANTVRASGQPVRRPRGQLKAPDQAAPVYAPARRLDYEVELGLYIGRASSAGQPVPVGRAGGHIFGYSLLNDWSARDVQGWEYQPLGPFATSVSPWVVTADALRPFHTTAFPRPAGDPAPLPHLLDVADQARGGIHINIEAALRTASMARQGLAAHRLSRSDTATLYWTFAQMVAHYTSNGSPLEVGDLLGSGTVSGPTDGALGSLLEITAGGSRPLLLPSGEQRTFLEDGDELVLTGFCEAPGQRRIGFGECRAIVDGADASGA
jgi:fumarylacetoacetase